MSFCANGCTAGNWKVMLSIQYKQVHALLDMKVPWLERRNSRCVCDWYV